MLSCAQTNSDRSPAPPIPEDRAADSYRIYSSLIPLGETAGKDWPHGLWLVQDQTIATVEQGKPCNDPAQFVLNPHTAVHAPQSSERDFNEILQDFDSHCHQRFALQDGKLRLAAPIRLLSADQQKRFQASRPGPQGPGKPAPEFDGAPALYGFSAVYFNKQHTVALVYATDWCASLCGQGMWIAMALKNGQWQPLNWPADHWIS
jgi:hypothetical protein